MKKKPIVKIDDVIQDGEFQFNKMLLKYFPQSESGEEDIGLSIEWSVMNAEVVETWWRLNASHLIFVDGYEVIEKNASVSKIY